MVFNPPEIRSNRLHVETRKRKIPFSVAGRGPEIPRRGCSSVVRATAAKAGGPGFDSRPRIHFSMNGGLVSRQMRVQLPDSYICAKLVDFALSAVEEMVRHFDVTTSD